MPRSSKGAVLLAYLVLLVAAGISLVPTIYMVDISLRNSVDSFSRC